MLGTRRGDHFFEPTSNVWARDFYRYNTAENDTCSAHVLRTHGNQHQARGLPMAWNCVLAKTADTDRNSCMFAHIAKVMFLTKRKRRLKMMEDNGVGSGGSTQCVE